MIFKEKVAIIDIGSNTIRLVVYGIDSNYDYIELLNIKTPARLSQFLESDDQGQKWMNQAGIDRLVEALNSFKQAAESLEANQIKSMATAAIRQSANQAEIFQQVQAKTGLTIELISEEGEALFGQYAVTHTMITPTAVTIDIGGGSCEITYFEDKQPIHFHSFPFGVVTLKEKFFKDKDHNDPEAIDELRAYVKKAFKSLDWLRQAQVPIIAIGGSARNIANVHQLASNYPMAGIHGYHMSKETLQETLDLFVTSTEDEMRDIEGLSNDRTDIIIPANLVFLELFRVVKATCFLISSQGLREGIILKYINNNYNTPLDNDQIRARTIRNLIRDLPVNTLGADQQVKFILKLYQELNRHQLMAYSFDQQEELEYAAILYRFGEFISPEADSQHTFYLLSNMNLFGFSHHKRLRLALLASYRNKSLFKRYLEDFKSWFSDEEIQDLQKLGGLLKFASGLNDSKTAVIEDIQLEATKDHNYLLKIYHHGPALAEYYRTHRYAKHLERALDGKLELKFIDI
ncbi:Ppx/GppA family phosphatase [Hutsoniella sourekii]|uniref:Ppx/GppA family phosphatase n=1 Tax=Hutsoniella sourekii TaxID=87650 RepID=UPI0004B600E6|nr:Ppx/GppA family phosphatase [Hutsoniella sourekii]